jgi:hypothetical protein
VIQRNNQDVAHIVPIPQSDWRDKMSIKPDLLVPHEELIKPMEDIWRE